MKYNSWYVFITITENIYHFVECVRKVRIQTYLMEKSYEDSKCLKWPIVTKLSAL